MVRLFHFGPYVLDTEQRVLLREGRIVALAPKVLETLQLLVAAQGRVVTKVEFMQALWPSIFVEESNLTQNIFILRRTLGTTAAGQHFIETIPKRGYRLTVPVSMDEIRAEPPQPVDVQVTVTRPHAVPAWPRWLWLLAGFLCVVIPVSTFFAARRSSEPEIRETGARRLTNDGMQKNLGPFPAAMVSDGQKLHFIERRDNQSVLANVPVEGGEVQVRPAPVPDAVVADYSRRYHRLLIGSVWRTGDDQPLLTEDDVTGRVSPMSVFKAHDASWSPDGDWMAFTHGRYLEIAKTDGSGRRQLAAVEGVAFWPRWSSDGHTLRFSQNYGDIRTQLWEVGADGHGLHQLLSSDPNRDHVCCGAWSNDGRWYFYVVTAPGASSIWAIPGQESKWPLGRPSPQQVIPANDMVWQGPVVNADGHKLWSIGSDARAELLRVDPDTRALKPYLDGISAEGVSFAPDRKTIAYTAYPEGTIWLARTDGSARKQLTYRPYVARFPRWSPDGRTLVFLAGQPGSAWRLYLADVASGAIRPLLKDTSNQGVANWSPDGGKLSLGRLPNYATGKDSELCIQIYDLMRHSLTTLRGSQGLWTPRWSPDGRYLAAVGGDKRLLRLYDMQHGTWSDLANIGANDVVWTPDSRYVFFDTVLGVEPTLYRVRIADKRVEAWADLRGLHRGGFYDPWLGVSPEGDPILLGDRTIEEVYEFTLRELPS